MAVSDRAVAAEPGEGDIAIGGATLAAEVAALGLIDEYRARVYRCCSAVLLPRGARRLVEGIRAA